MWIILPVKRLQNTKFRLSGCLSQAQRATLSLMMLHDVLDALVDSKVVKGVTIISSDESLLAVAEDYKVECLLTESDEGYSEDALKAIESISDLNIDRIAILPADVPLLNNSDLAKLNDGHKKGITLCPAKVDGGTNGLLFSAPLKMPLLFGLNSLENYVNKAGESGIPCQLVETSGLERDIDVPADIAWLLKQPVENKTIRYLRSLDIPNVPASRIT